MNARLVSWLVAGSIVLVGGLSGPLYGKLPARESAEGYPSIVAASLESDDASALIKLQIPGFFGKPAVQTLPSPNRIVVDFHGVDRGTVPNADISRLAHPYILKARLRQFAVEPEHITRFVLEVVPGTKAVVSSQPHGGVEISLTKGTGKIRASLSEDTFTATTAGNRVMASLTDTVSQEQSGSIYLAPSESRQIVANLEPTSNASEPEENFPLYSMSSAPVEELPQIGSPYVGLPSLGSMPIAPLAVAQTQEFTSDLAPRYAVQKPVKNNIVGDMESGYHGERMDMDVQNAELRQICLVLAKTGGLNLIMDPEVQSGGYTFYFENTPWDQILDIVIKNAGLGKEVSNGIIRIAKMDKLKKEEEDRKALEEAKALAGNLITVTRGLSYAKVDEAQKIVVNMKSERGKIFTDARTNTMILTDLPRYVDAMQQLLDQLDVKVPQVQIDARIVEANRGWQKEFGVSWPQSNTGNANLRVDGQNASWGAENGPSWNSINSRPSGDNSNRYNAAFSPGKQGVTDIPVAAGEIWVSFLSNRLSLNAIIQALEKNNQIKVVSEPKLTVQNNHAGIISDGSRIPYQSNQSGMAGGAITVQFVEAKLRLEVTPQITNDGSIILDVSINKDQPDFGQQVNGTPTILSKDVKTTVRVSDGGTAVLGGVFTNSVDSGSTGVPFLSKLPGVGWMFRNKTNNDKTTEMLVMISPKIID